METQLLKNTFSAEGRSESLFFRLSMDQVTQVGGNAEKHIPYSIAVIFSRDR